MSYKTPEQIRRESIEQLKRLRPIDDIFMREMFRNNIELTEFALRAITEISDLVITEVHTQYDLHRLAGSRSLRIDVHGRDSADRRYSMEIERSDKGASPYRSRYISSAMDVEFLNTRDEFTELPVSYVIFITESDIFGEGKLVYRIERMNVTIGKPFNDGEHIIYLNSSYKNEGETSGLAKLAHDFLCEDPDDMHLPLMAETARYYKENPKGVEHMCQSMEDRIKAETAAETAAQAIEIALGMILKGKLSLEEIAEYSKLPIDEIRSLAEKNRPAAT
ncbi:MAG: hypothetical protein K2N72_11900 [Oscillospiraceae bacterium]|nr:hypothetical protein [Oscillospiraceae bacterium]